MKRFLILATVIGGLTFAGFASTANAGYGGRGGYHGGYGHVEQCQIGRHRDHHGNLQRRRKLQHIDLAEGLCHRSLIAETLRLRRMYGGLFLDRSPALGGFSLLPGVLGSQPWISGRVAPGLYPDRGFRRKE